jgi:protein arginine kinase activator
MCAQCGEREAVVSVTHVEGDSVDHLQLCERCAAARGVDAVSASQKHPLGDFLQAVHQQVSSGPDAAGVGPCAFCGMTMQDFRTVQRWGCAHCYGHFERAIRELLRRVHGSSRHVGRGYDQPPAEEMQRQSLLGELRDKLRRAVEREDFEQAAELRDRLRVME